MKRQARKYAESKRADGQDRTVDLRFTKPLPVYIGTGCNRSRQNVIPGPTGRKTRAANTRSTDVRQAAQRLAASIARGDLSTLAQLRLCVDRMLPSKLSRSQQRRLAVQLSAGRRS